MDALDHRRLAENPDLFHRQEDRPDILVPYPYGWTVYRVLEDHLRACRGSSWQVLGAWYHTARHGAAAEVAVKIAAGSYDDGRR